jgi:hypothetical protein
MAVGNEWAISGDTDGSHSVYFLIFFFRSAFAVECPFQGLPKKPNPLPPGPPAPFGQMSGDDRHHRAIAADSVNERQADSGKPTRAVTRELAVVMQARRIGFSLFLNKRPNAPPAAVLAVFSASRSRLRVKSPLRGCLVTPSQESDSALQAMQCR